MMSESPILLIDAQYVWDYGRRKTCYFIPDAHHTVPFEYNADLNKYIAPPWFDAILEHNGTPNTQDPTAWDQPPTEFILWLQRGAVEYTFTAHYEDVPEDMHARPTAAEADFTQIGLPNPVLKGIPHYVSSTTIVSRTSTTAT
jgi:hypothetical protein